jgi:predicted TIM-barrel fold metal-dependent hydrolase
MFDDDIPLIDFRVRPPFRSFIASFFSLRWPLDEAMELPGIVRACFKTSVPSRDEQSMEKFMQEMDEAAVHSAVVMGRPGVSNADIAALIAAYPRRFHGFGSIDVTDASCIENELGRFRDHGFSGVALDNAMLASPLRNDDGSLDAIYRFCEETALLVCLNGSFMLAPDLSYIDPIAIQRTALRYPKLKIVVAHACWPWVMQLCAVALMCPNVYLIPDLYSHMPGQSDYFQAMGVGLESQILYGSSYTAMSLPASAAAFRSAIRNQVDADPRRVFEVSARLLGL